MESKFYFAIKLNTWKDFQKKMIKWSVQQNYNVSSIGS